MRSLALYVVAALALSLGAARAEEIVNLPTRPGVTQSFWLLMPDGGPAASVILLAGGEGILGAAAGGPPKSNNFLVRTRAQFASAGFVVALLDNPSEWPEGLGQHRNSEEHARDVAAVIAYLRNKAKVPVWLVGTSRGTISAANAAARLRPPEGADGLVLTSSITAPSRRIAPIWDEVDLDKIALPTLVVHNRDDRCDVTPFSRADRILEKLIRAPRKELIAFEGGAPPVSDPCEGMSRHGFIGIEKSVVDAIVKWIKSG